MYQLIKYGESVQGSFPEYSRPDWTRSWRAQQEAQKRMKDWGLHLSLGKERREAQASGETDQEAVFKEELEQLKRKMQEK